MENTRKRTEYEVNRIELYEGRPCVFIQEKIYESRIREQSGAGNGSSGVRDLGSKDSYR